MVNIESDRPEGGLLASFVVLMPHGFSPLLFHALLAEPVNDDLLINAIIGSSGLSGY